VETDKRERDEAEENRRPMLRRLKARDLIRELDDPEEKGMEDLLPRDDDDKSDVRDWRR